MGRSAESGNKKLESRRWKTALFLEERLDRCRRFHQPERAG
jgi:hypothetical protein